MPARRAYLTALGGGSVVALAGCSSQDDDGLVLSEDQGAYGRYYSIDLDHAWDSIRIQQPDPAPIVVSILVDSQTWLAILSNEEYELFKDGEDFPAYHRTAPPNQEVQLGMEAEPNTTGVFYVVVDNRGYYGDFDSEPVEGELSIVVH